MDIFAFSYYNPNYSKDDLFTNGWDIYNPYEEFKRQGLDYELKVIILDSKTV